MALTFTLPKDSDFDPGDGHVLNLSFHVVNSVDGRCRLRIMLGWLRFICGNGLVVGTAMLNQRFVHNEYLKPRDLTHPGEQYVSGNSPTMRLCLHLGLRDMLT
jgi:hypothetical protein